MLITEPVITTQWEEQGAYLIIYTYIYMKATTEPKVRGQAVDGEKPKSIHLIISKSGVRNNNHLNPEAMKFIDDWVEAKGLVSLWKQEEAIYRDTMGTINLPGIKPESIQRSLEYEVYIGGPEGAACLHFLVRVNKQDGAKGYLYLDGEYGMEEGNCIAQYKLDYPITMGRIKGMVFTTMLEYCQYLDPLRPPERA